MNKGLMFWIGSLTCSVGAAILGGISSKIRQDEMYNKKVDKRLNEVILKTEQE